MFDVLGVFLAWFVAFLCLDMGESMWTPKTKEIISVTAGPKKDTVFRMQGDYYAESYCPLNTVHMYPYLVKVYADSPVYHREIRTGIILTHNAVLTTCEGYSHFHESQLSLTTQRVFYIDPGPARRTSILCYQTRRVLRHEKHPKCANKYGTRNVELADYWDFGLLILDLMFYAEREFVYPVAPIPKQPYELSEMIRKIRSLYTPRAESGDAIGCEMPYFKEIFAPWAVFEYRAEVDVLDLAPGQEIGGCIDVICYSRIDSTLCRKELRKWMEGGFICIVPRWQSRFPNPLITTPELGAPLVCNATVVGIIGMYTRQRLYPWYDQSNREYPDVLVTNTLLRVWPWIMEAKHNYWNASWNREAWDSPFLEQHIWRRFSYTTEQHDKEVAKDPKRFRFFVGGSEIPLSHGNKPLAIFLMVFANSLILVSRIV
ncbi:hypothetical protein GE061_007353 [Apolygus lucorum]|uniref:Protein kinase domain-containing protein n=1 Tax=Apolygus lucorum TaxID=248454 RepID=A0A8S9WRN9_APOLU|nr:hypothetical protein GE061_007353 [Apolygus lucorum]